MKKFYTLFLSFLLLVTTTYAYTQEAKTLEIQPPDYPAIEKAIKNPASPYYYPPLLKRLRAYDATLTEKEFQHLYYGYVFNEHYSPYRYLDKQQQDKFDAILVLYDKGQYNSANATKLIELGDQYLHDYPFDSYILKLMQSVYSKEGNQTRAIQMRWVLNSLFVTLIKSGDATSCDSAIHVLAVDHEYYFLERVKITRDKLSGQQLIGKCDLLMIDKSKLPAKIEGFYFNIERLIQHTMNTFQAEKK